MNFFSSIFVLIVGIPSREAAFVDLQTPSNDTSDLYSPIDPFSYRFIENTSPELLSELSDWELEMLSAQNAMDAQNDRYTPFEDIEDEDLIELTPMGFLKLSQVVHAGYESVIYAVQDHDDLLIKYQVMCSDLGKPMLHPLITDYWFMLEAFELDLAPQPLFLSPPTLLLDIIGRNGNRKFPFTMPTEDLSVCLAEDAQVRFMVMRKNSGETLAQFRRRFEDGIIPMQLGAQIMISLIQSLQKLHEIGQIVHGDIHLGNVLLEPVGESQTDYRIVLIDFGRAARDDRNLTNDRINTLGQWSHQLCSPWQMDGRAWARRDDIYKAVHMFAAMINPYEYYVREKNYFRRAGLEKAIRAKRGAFIFLLPPKAKIGEKRYDSDFDSLVSAIGPNPKLIKHLVDELNRLRYNVIERLDDINADIKYREIIENFRWIRAIIKTARS